ncbi:MAG: chemotaxis response regulator protein-glutamate methylesterase [Planctomycetota bacterium]|jgi:two-component system chemotaxis response regulator CheB
MNLRVLLVDDSALFRTHLANAIRGIDGWTVVGFADDGEKAIEQARLLKPDVITLDIEMPKLNGIEVLRRLTAEGIPSKIIMVSRLTNEGAQETTDALLSGAFDFILKPQGRDPVANRDRLIEGLREKLQAARASIEDHVVDVQRTPSKTAAAPASQRPATKLSSEIATMHFECVVIGCSTGGPDALARIIPMVPPNFPAPILIVQHMPAGFTKSLAKRLDEASEIRVVEAEHGMSLERGTAYLAPGGWHVALIASNSGPAKIMLNEDPKVNNCRPSVDYTLKSTIALLGRKVLAVILTGMGKDGLEGCRELSTIGGYVVAQAPEGCTVYGMPKAVAQAGIANLVIPLDDIPKVMAKLVGARRSSL